MHFAAAAYALGATDEATVTLCLRTVGERLNDVCRKCASSFATKELPRLLGVGPDELERAIYDLRNSIANESGRPREPPPTFESVREAGRAHVRDTVSASLKRRLAR